jgi:hypothetical protein
VNYSRINVLNADGGARDGTAIFIRHQAGQRGARHLRVGRNRITKRQDQAEAQASTLQKRKTATAIVHYSSPLARFSLASTCCFAVYARAKRLLPDEPASANLRECDANHETTQYLMPPIGNLYKSIAFALKKKQLLLDIKSIL